MQETKDMPIQAEKPNFGEMSPVDPSWNAKAKKKAGFIMEHEDGSKTFVPVMDRIRLIAKALPAMQSRFGKPVNHVENMKYCFMKGKTKAESEKLVDDYCNDVITQYEKAVEEHKRADGTMTGSIQLTEE